MKKAKIVTLKKENTNDPDEVKKTVTESADHYHNLIKQNPLNQKAYERLMILYRKEKDYKKELSVINAGIRSFQTHYHEHHAKQHADRKVNSISKQLNKAFGLTDKKGKPLYDQEPIETWKKRKEIVLKKLKKD